MKRRGGRRGGGGGGRESVQRNASRKVFCLDRGLCALTCCFCELFSGFKSGYGSLTLSSNADLPSPLRTALVQSQRSCSALAESYALDAVGICDSEARRRTRNVAGRCSSGSCMKDCVLGPGLLCKHTDSGVHLLSAGHTRTMTIQYACRLAAILLLRYLHVGDGHREIGLGVASA